MQIKQSCSSSLYPGSLATFLSHAYQLLFYFFYCHLPTIRGSQFTYQHTFQLWKETGNPHLKIYPSLGSLCSSSWSYWRLRGITSKLSINTSKTKNATLSSAHTHISTVLVHKFNKLYLINLQVIVDPFK